MTRLKFLLCKYCSKLRILAAEHSPRYREKIDAQISKFDDIEDIEELQQLAKELESEYEEYVKSEPDWFLKLPFSLPVDAIAAAATS